MGDAVRAEALVREHARFALRGVKNAIDRPGRAAKAKATVANSAPAGRSAPHRTHDAETAGPTSQLLLDAAAALFCEKGFSETTTREIAARLNIHQASLYYHISGKEELLYRISRVSLEALERQVVGALQNRGNARDRLNAFIRGHLHGMFENPNRALAFISEFRSLSRAHRREMTVLRRNYSDLLNREIASAVKAGILRRDIPVSSSGSRFSTISTGHRAGISSRAGCRWTISPESTIGCFSRALSLRATEDLPCRSCKACAGDEPAPDTTALSASSSALRRNCFRNRVTRSTSTRSLSALIGMEKATLYYHVKSKEDLLYLITKSSVETLQEDVKKAVEGITCPLEHLAVLIRAHCMSLLRDQTQHATALAEVRSLSPERLAEIVSLRKTYQTGIRRDYRGRAEERIHSRGCRATLSRFHAPGTARPDRRVVPESRFAWTCRIGGLLLRHLSVRSREGFRAARPCLAETLPE